MRSVLVTRPQPVADEMADKLRHEGFGVYLAPLMAYVEAPADLSPLRSCQAIVFTSAQAVTFFTAREQERTLPVFAVGDATARAAERQGFLKVYSAKGDSDDLLELIRSRKKEFKIRQILHVCGEDTVQDLGRAVKKDKMAVSRAVIYKAQLLDTMPSDIISALQDGRITTVTLFSARTAANFVKLLQSKNIANVSDKLEAVCISNRVAAEIKSLPWRAVRIAANPNMEAVLDVLKSNENISLPTEGTKTMTSDEQKKQDLHPRGEDRRKNRAPIDAEGRVHDPNYTGPNRRSGIDRRAHQERQLQRIREEKQSFLKRAALMAAVCGIALLYAGAFLMAPEFFHLQKNKALMQQLEEKIKILSGTLESLQEKQGSIGGAINTKIEQMQNATSSVTTAVKAASSAPYQELQRLVQMLSDVRILNSTSSGQAAILSAIGSLQTALAGAAPQDATKLTQILLAAKQKNPVLNQLLGDGDGKNLASSAILFALDKFRSDVHSQKSFDQTLSILRTLSSPYPEVQKTVDALAPYASTGVNSYQTLQQEFKNLAIDIVSAKLQGEDLSVQEQVLKRIDHLVKVRKTDDISSKSVDAIVARAQILMDSGDIKGAIRELQALEGAPAKTAQPWIDSAQGTINTVESSDQLTDMLLKQLSASSGTSLEGIFGDLFRPAGSSVPYISPALRK